MKKFYKWVIGIMAIVVILGIVGFVFSKKETPAVVEAPVVNSRNECEDLSGGLVDCTETGAILMRTCDDFSGCVDVVQPIVLEPEVILPTTGSVSVSFDAQPTKLAGYYTDNGLMLRARAEKNIKKLDIPADAKEATIAFKLIKASKYNQLPGNIQLSVNGKNLCNGRLTLTKTMDGDRDAATYIYPLNAVYTQDKPKGIDLTSAIGKTLTIKAWIGENGNRLESVTVDYSL